MCYMVRLEYTSGYLCGLELKDLRFVSASGLYCERGHVSRQSGKFYNWLHSHPLLVTYSVLQYFWMFFL